MFISDIFESKTKSGKCFLTILRPEIQEPIIWD